MTCNEGFSMTHSLHRTIATALGFCVLCSTMTSVAQGIRLEYRISVESVRDEQLQVVANELTVRLAEEGYSINFVISESEIRVTQPIDSDTRMALEQELASEHFSMHEVTEEELTYCIRLTQEFVEDLHVIAMSSALSIIEERLGGMSAEPSSGVSVYQSGDDGIVVEIPEGDLDDPAAASRLIERRGWLAFHEVSSENATFWPRFESLIPPGNPCGLHGPDMECPTLEAFDELAAAIDRQREALGVSADVMVRAEQIRRYDEMLASVETSYQAILLNREVALTNSSIAETMVHTDLGGNPYVGMTFDEASRVRFCTLTTTLVGGRLAIVLDNIVLSAPTISEPICGGRARIDIGAMGSFDAEYREAHEMVIMLQSGSLPSVLELVEATNLVTRHDPFLGIDVDSEDFSSQLNSFFTEGDFTPLGRPADHPGGYRISDGEELGIDVLLTAPEGGLVQRIRFEIVQREASPESLSALEQRFRQLCDDYETVLGPSHRSGTGPIFGCYWMDEFDEITSNIEYYPPNEGGPSINAEIVYR